MSYSTDVEQFTRRSRAWDTSLLHRVFFSQVHAAVVTEAARYAAPGDILDIGCGTGLLLRASSA